MRTALLLLFVAVGCSPTPADPTSLSREQIEQNLAAQAEEVGRAMLAQDFARMADLTHPELVRKLGGREKCIERFGWLAEKTRLDGFRCETVTTTRPTTLGQVYEKWFGVVPCDIDMTAPDGTRARVRTYQIAESVDGGRTWRFADSFGFDGNHRKLRVIMPDFPADVPVPVTTPPQFIRD